MHATSSVDAVLPPKNRWIDSTSHRREGGANAFWTLVSHAWDVGMGFYYAYWLRWVWKSILEPICDILASCPHSSSTLVGSHCSHLYHNDTAVFEMLDIRVVLHVAVMIVVVVTEVVRSHCGHWLRMCSWNGIVSQSLDC